MPCLACLLVQAEVGAAALGSPLARRLLGPPEQQLPGAGASAPELDYHGAVALAAACALAAEGCGGRMRGGGGAQLPWPFYLIGTRDSFTHHLVPVRCGVWCCLPGCRLLLLPAVFEPVGGSPAHPQTEAGPPPRGRACPLACSCPAARQWRPRGGATPAQSTFCTPGSAPRATAQPWPPAPAGRAAAAARPRRAGSGRRAAGSRKRLVSSWRAKACCPSASLPTPSCLVRRSCGPSRRGQVGQLRLDGAVPCCLGGGVGGGAVFLGCLHALAAEQSCTALFFPAGHPARCLPPGARPLTPPQMAWMRGAAAGCCPRAATTAPRRAAAPSSAPSTFSAPGGAAQACRAVAALARRDAAQGQPWGPALVPACPRLPDVHLC